MLYFLCRYTGNGRGIGVFVSQEAITPENNYFELNILNTDMFGAVSIGWYNTWLSSYVETRHVASWLLMQVMCAD